MDSTHSTRLRTQTTLMAIPLELLIEILSRLPAKSLARFKKVSKNFRALISEPQFVKRHQNAYNHGTQLICKSVINPTSLYSLPFSQLDKIPKQLPRQDDEFIFQGTCNGLVLADTKESLVVMNPSTGQFVELPECDDDVVRDPLNADCMFGFGYDSVHDDYKVVTISYYHFDYMIPCFEFIMCAHVYSLRKNTWTRVMDSPYDHSHGNSVPGVFVNGFLHWVADAVDNDASESDSHATVIVGFSLADEEFREVPSPDMLSSKRNCKLAVIGEKLGVFVEDEIWLMSEYGVKESWVKISINGLDQVVMAETNILCDGTGKKVMLVGNNGVWVCDIEAGSVHRAVDDEGFLNREGLMVTGAYLECLVWTNFSVISRMP